MLPEGLIIRLVDQRDEKEPTEFAGKEPRFISRTRVMCAKDRKMEEVFILDYIRDDGLYLVATGSGKFFRVNPRYLLQKKK